ncbi:MAG: alanine racemase [Flavobacteriales bacterium]
MHHTSWIELDRKALAKNIRYMKGLAPASRYSMVIKGNAYGHGIEDLLPLLEDCGVDHFSVFSVAEAMRALEVKKEVCDLMIMGFIGDGYHEWAIENGISFFVFTQERLEAALEAAKKSDRAARVHIELETGMHRTGFPMGSLGRVIDTFKRNPDALELEGLCTHFAGAENQSNFDRVDAQIRNYEEACAFFRAKGLEPRYRHVACSAGVLNYPAYTMDLIRVGISSYGFWPSEETKTRHLAEHGLTKDPLDRVLTWKSNILSVNHVPEGEYVSYGKSYLTNRPSKVATVPVGYGYGFSRDLSNNGHVLVNEKRVPVVGAVNMNMMVIDVTDLPHVKIGDEVVLIGSQGDLMITVSSFGDMNKSLNYELLARLPQHIPRFAVG